MALLWRFSLLGAFAVLLSVSASSQSLPRAPKTEVITVTPKPGYFSEPSIAVNPAKPQQVVAAFQDNAHIAYSADGGRHWQLATGIEPPNYRVSGDVSVTFDNEGRAYICYIAFDKLGTFNYWGHNSSRNGIYVRRSLDEARPGNHRILRQLSSQIKPRFRGKTSPTSLQIWDAGLTPATFI